MFSRHLAYHDKTQWSEYWDFLGEFCDFAKPNGLEKLEEYLGGKSYSEDPLVDSLSSKHLRSGSNSTPRSVTGQLGEMSLTSTPQDTFLTG